MKNAEHLKREQTMVIIKPDGVQRTLIGEVIKRYERSGLKLIALKMALPTETEAEKHYTLDPEWVKKVGLKLINNFNEKGLTPPFNDPIKMGESILARLVKYLTAGPVILMVWEGAHAVGVVRKITGGTEPLSSDVGTIRGDFVTDSYQIAELDNRAVRNIIHASGTIEEAKKEINLWFKPTEIIKYRLAQDAIIHDVNLDNILE